MATVAERLKEIMDIKNLRQVDLVRLAEPVGEESGKQKKKSQGIFFIVFPKNTRLFLQHIRLIFSLILTAGR